MKLGAILCALCCGGIALAGAARAEDDLGERLIEDLRYLVEDAAFVADTHGVGYWDTPPETGDPWAADGALRLEIAGPLLSNLEVAATPVAYWSSSSGIVENKVTLSERGRARPRLGMEEAWLAWQDGSWTVKAGKQIFTWGATDLVPLSDDLNARDKLDVPWAFKLGEPALAISRVVPGLGLDLVLIPTFTPDRLPQQDNPWSRSRGRIADAAQARTGIRPAVVDGARSLPNGADGVQAGIRATSSTLLEGTDLSVSLFRGIARTPILRPRPVSPAVLALDSIYPRYTELAAGFSTVVSDYVLHGEAAMHWTEQSQEDDDYLSFVVGGRREWAAPGFLDISTVRLTLEYAGEMITRHVSATSPFIRSSFDRTATNSILSKLDVEFDEYTTLTLGGGINIEQGDYAADTRLEHKLNDNLTLSGGVQLFAGPSRSFFGEWRDNDRAYVAAEFYW